MSGLVLAWLALVGIPLGILAPVVAGIAATRSSVAGCGALVGVGMLGALASFPFVLAVAQGARI